MITRADGSQATLTYSTAKSPAEVDWAAAGTEVALECSGKFLNRATLQPFFDAVSGVAVGRLAIACASGPPGDCCRRGGAARGAPWSCPRTACIPLPHCTLAHRTTPPGRLPLQGVKKVVVSAPVKDPAPVLNIVYGVNHVRRRRPGARAGRGLQRTPRRPPRAPSPGRVVTLPSRGHSPAHPRSLLSRPCVPGRSCTTPPTTTS